MNLLIQFTENDKRLIFALLIVFVLVFVLIGVIGAAIQRVMKWQGKKMDTLCHDVVVTKVITNKKALKRYGRKKNWALFYKQSWLPIVLMLLAGLILLIANIFWYDFKYNMFDMKKQGFTTLFFLWDFNDPESYTKVFGMTVLAKWPPLINSPHFEVDAITSYLFLPLFSVGLIWYLIAVQCLISRAIRLFKLSTSIFEKNLEGYNQTTGFQNPMNMMNNSVNQTNNAQNPPQNGNNQLPPQ